MAKRPHKRPPLSWRKRKTVHQPPGTLIADPSAQVSRLTMLAFGPGGVEERADVSLEEVTKARTRWPVVWLDMSGLGAVDVLQKIGEMHRLHPLLLEDVVNTHQRPKLELFDDLPFLVLRMLQMVDGQLGDEQLCIVLGQGWVLTFQETPGDCFEPLRERIRKDRGQVRRSGADYLAYALIDALVDHYFPLLESLGDRFATLEEEVLRGPHVRQLEQVYALKRQLALLRRAVFPLREVLGQLARGDVAAFGAETRPYLRDCADHAFQVIEVLEAAREAASALTELNWSAIGHRTNEVMKFLTMMATLFIPLSFVAGLYGMNFDRAASPWNLPELGWYYGYPMALGVMASIVCGMLFFFHRKGWLWDD
ncbi:MAG: magnesium/cobalt transporter CorA [Planctomycetota bacterium]